MRINFTEAEIDTTIDLSRKESRALQKVLGHLSNPLRAEMNITDTEADVLTEIHNYLYHQFGSIA